MGVGDVMASLITTSTQWLEESKTNPDSQWWFVEVNPSNFEDDDEWEENRFSVVRTEILRHPLNFTELLDSGQFRIWKTIPITYIKWGRT